MIIKIEKKLIEIRHINNIKYQVGGFDLIKVYWIRNRFVFILLGVGFEISTI